MTEIRQDIRYALRVLRRAPGFTAAAIATLALGIGASTTIFTVVNSILVKPLRLAEPHRLMMVWALLPEARCCARVSSAYLHEWRIESRSFQDLAGWYDVSVTIAGGGQPFEAVADRVTPNFFTVLGTPAFLGRTLTAGSDVRLTKPEVVLSHGFWRRRYGGDPHVVGGSIVVDGERFTIVGVMPEGFAVRTVELPESRADLWTPFPLTPGDLTGMGGTLSIIGRLAPRSSLAQAQAELALIARRIEQAHPSYSRNWEVGVIPLHDAVVKDVRLTLLMLFGSVGILLLIACANVASLVLTRATTRSAELAIRLSLGATMGRLMRQLLTECLVLAVIGSAVGVLLAAWGTRLLVTALPAGLLPRAVEIGVDLRMFVFAGLLTIVVTILCGLAPSMTAVRSAPSSALREAIRIVSSVRGRARFTGALVVAEVALALILLSGAGLLGRSFWKLSRVNPGFQSEKVLTMRVTLGSARYESDDRRRSFASQLLDRIEHLPGVGAVGSVNYLPLSRVGAGISFDIEGRPVRRPEDQPGAFVSIIGGRYFDAMGIPLLRGRLPDAGDTEMTERVFVIDDELARRYWPSEDPVGARLTWRTGDGQRMSGTVIGIVGSVRWTSMATKPNGTTYLWFSQAPDPRLTIVARTFQEPMMVAGPIAANVAAIDAGQPVADVRALGDVVSTDLAQSWFTTVLFGSFAAGALLLSAIGLYGLIAFTVTQRTYEIGVRVALGAGSGDVLHLIMRRGIALTGAGLAIGIAATLALGRIAASLLYDVTPTDKATLLGATLFLGAVAMLATYLPARRATRVDPLLALRM